MRLLDRYLLRELLAPLGYCLTGFLILWISSDLIANLDEFREAGLHATGVARYYIYTLPSDFSVVLPVALLLALLYAITAHARHNELVAIRCAGFSMWRLSLPYLSLGLFLSVVLLVSNEYWAPRSVQMGEQLMRPGEGGTDRLGPGWIRNISFRNDRAGRVWNISAYHPEKREMLRPHLTWPLHNAASRDVIAGKGVWENDHWTFYNVTNYLAPPDDAPEAVPRLSRTNRLELEDLDESPGQILSEIQISPLFDKRPNKKWRVSIREILQYQYLHPNLAEQSPSKASLLETQLHSRIAEPFTCLVVVLIALPFGAPSGRRNAFVGASAGVVVCLAYFMVQQLSMAFGASVSPLLAAWLPNLMFGGAGAWLTSRVR